MQKEGVIMSGNYKRFGCLDQRRQRIGEYAAAVV